MKSFNIFSILHALFRMFIVFLFLFVWCNYYLNNFWISFTICLFITLLFELFFYLFLKKKNKKLNELQKINNNIINCTNAFIYNTNLENVSFFYNLIKLKYNATKKSKYIIIENLNKQIILYPYFLFRDFNCDDLIEIYNKIKNIKYDKIIILTNNINSDVFKQISLLNKNIFVLDHNETYYQFLKEFNYYPKIIETPKNIKPNFKQLVSVALNKKRTKSYFLTSVLLIFCSFFVPYKLFYLIISSLLLILAFISFTNIKFNIANSSNILDD